MTLGDHIDVAISFVPPGESYDVPVDRVRQGKPADDLLFNALLVSTRTRHLWNDVVETIYATLVVAGDYPS